MGKLQVAGASVSGYVYDFISSYYVPLVVLYYLSMFNWWAPFKVICQIRINNLLPHLWLARAE